MPACGSKSLDARVDPSLVKPVRQSQLLNTVAAGWSKKLEIAHVSQMPELDGYAASRKIRSREQPGHRVTIVASTAEALEDSREAGIDNCISKPVKRNGICEAPRKWLAPRGIEDASSSLPAAALVQAGAGDVPSS